MNVLICFEESGAVREAFRRLGHDAWSCDLEPARDGSPYHLQCDAFAAMVRENNFPIGTKWDLIIMHPPCTAITVAGNHVYAYGKPKHSERLKALAVTGCYWRFAIEICGRVCLENPQGVLHTNLPWLPKPQYIQPYQYGEDASKKTGLTLHGLPRLEPTKIINGRLVCKCGNTFEYDLGIYGCPNCCGDSGPAVERWDNQTDSGQNKLGPSPTRARDRSKTYQGIADAMADQWDEIWL